VLGSAANPVINLHDALLLYSRNSTASETTDKLVFVLVSLESMLPKDANEPISKNIGERMAFLVGNSVERAESSCPERRCGIPNPIKIHPSRRVSGKL
jgi:hypothetical protein